MFHRIMVTGYSGFVGPWVTAELRRHFPGAVICGAARHVAAAIEQTALPDRCFRLDLRNSEQIRAVVEEARPDAVVHLASLKLAALDELLAVNVTGCELLLGHLDTIVPGARILVVGSSAELGRATERDVPLDEAAPCRPVDCYGVSKLAQSAIAVKQALRGQDVVLLRPFNLFGPGMPDSLLGGRCVEQLCAAARSSRSRVMEFGSLEARRDYLDVRDFAHALALALEKSPAGMLYHIGSGMSRSGHDLVDALVRQADLDVTYRAAAAVEQSLVPWQTADWRRAHHVLGWQPTIGWDQTIRDIWDAARSPERMAEMMDLPRRPDHAA